MKHTVILIALAALVCFLPGSFATEQLRIVTVDEPPANFIDSSGQQSGYVLDIVKLLQQEMKSNAKVEFMPEARALNLAKTKPNIVLFSFSRTTNRENQFHWIGKVMEKTWRVFALTDSNVKIERLEDLRKLNSIGVVRGDIRHEWFVSKNFSNLSVVTRHKQNLKMLLKGRIEVVVHESHAIAYLMEELNLPRTKLKPLFDVNKSDVYIMISKSTPKETVIAWQSAFNKLESSKQIYNTAKSWRSKISHQLHVGAKIQNGILVF